MSEMQWTGEQAAALTAEGHRLLVANAGTGKTTTVVHKILWLLGEDVGVNGESGERIARCSEPCTLSEIAAITFTEKAAYDLKRKLREELRKSARADTLLWELEQAALGTIHSFCGQLLREHALRMGIDPGFSVLDEQDARLQQDHLIRDLLLECLQAGDREVAELVRIHTLAGSKFTNGTIDFVRAAFRDLRWHAQRYASWCEQGELSGARLSALFGGAIDSADQKIVGRCRALHRLAVRMLERWHAFEEAENVRDFDSLILDTRALLTGPDGGAALNAIRRRYRILIIDEFQDTDGAQRDIAYAIARAVERPQLFLVGDPKQSIYRFRGADISVWNSVQDDLASLSVLPLSRNFRSEPAILQFVNTVSSASVASTGQALQQIPGESGVAYTALTPHRSTNVGSLEWIVPEDGKEQIRRGSEAKHVAQRIAELVGKELVIDIETGKPRECRYSDIAVLYRARTGLAAYLDALRTWGIPYFEHSPTGLAERQEVQDVLNVMRLLHNPADDLRAFAYLRSPFVGLRDEVLVRIRKQDGWGTYLQKATRYLTQADWFAAPEHPDVASIERDALRNGLHAFKRARELAERLPIDELLEFVLSESGYRQHLLLLPGSREALANIQAFLHLIEQYRDHTLGRFLEVWDSRDEEDPGMPQGQLFGAGEDIVTLSTIHAAKGLEWPVVFLVDTSSPFQDDPWGTYWSDPVLGPLLCPKGEERGARANLIVERYKLREAAERARLLYVVSTRARDRLIVLGTIDSKRFAFSNWLQQGVRLCTLHDGGTPEYAGARAPELTLAWLDVIRAGAPALSSAVLPAPPHRFMTSATEQMTRARDPLGWERTYIHGIEPVWHFAPRGKGKELPERLRGDVIHGILERMTPDSVIAEVLEETIGELDTPELEFVLAPGSERRAELIAEIERVIASAEWKWYVEGEHHRELPFLHLAGTREWRIGAFDLYRPDGWVIDFKTHQITAERVAHSAEDYRLQMNLYRAAAAVRGVVRTQLHFTHCNEVLELTE